MYGYGCFISANGKPTSGTAFTSRTAAFKTATGITDATILNALNTLDLGLISNSLDSKLLSIYPMVGGTSTTNSYNFINTSQYQLTWYGGWTHSSNGVTPNGTNAYADTGINPNTLMSLNNTGMGVYLRTNIAENSVDIGCQSSGTAYQLYIYSRYSDNNYYGAVFSDNHSITNTDSRGLFSVTRSSSNVQKLYKNGTLVKTGSEVSTSKVTNNIAIGAVMRDLNTQANFSSKQNAFTYVLNSALSDSEVSTFYSLIQDFQTSLSRQV